MLLFDLFINNYGSSSAFHLVFFISLLANLSCTSEEHAVVVTGLSP